MLPIAGKFSAAKQRALAVEIMKAVGFPFDRGRLDESEHPFTEGVPGDVRVTTRFDTAEPFSGLLGALHETGHAMYDVGLPVEFADQPVGRDRGMALEESQSLLMEMIVCRSRAFVTYLRPLLEKHFGVSGPEWSEENLYAHLTRVKRGLIRVDADELTYPVHIHLRYELENQLLGGKLAVRDLRDAWNAGGTPVRLNNRSMYVFNTRDERGAPQAVVSYVAPNQVGYMFVAPELSTNELLDVVSRTNLEVPQ